MAEIDLGLVGLLTAMLAGLLSFLSPCVLPLVPSYVAFLAGVQGVEEEKGAARVHARRSTMVHAGAFVIGFSLVFVALGASATAIGGALRDEGDWIARIGGVMLVLFGLVVVGLAPGGFWRRDTRLLDRASALRSAGPAGSAVVGAAFGAGWTPCIGPVLAGILTLAAATSTTTEGVLLLAAYSLGLAVPFLAAAFALDRFTATSARFRRWMPWVNRASGMLLIGLGVLLATGMLARLTTWLARFTPAWLV